MEIKISVIVPVYNVEKYLEACLESVIGQHFDGLEILCVNDRSTDSSLDIIKKYKSRYTYIKLIENKRNGGLSYSRNRGLEFAQGKYILFLDSDDYLRENALSILYQNAEKLNTDILYFDKEIVYEKDYNGPKDYVSNENLKYAQIYSGMELFTECAKIKTFKSVNAYTQFFQREFLGQNHLTFYDGIVHEDLLFYFLCAVRAKRVSKIKEELYIYRKRNGSITEKISETRKQSVFIVLSEIWNIWKSRIFSKSEDNAIKVYLEMIYQNFLKYQQSMGSDEALLFGNSADLFLYQMLQSGPVNKKYVYVSFDESERDRICSSDSVWIYGAGAVGSETAIFLEETHKQIKGFLVSHIEREETRKFGYPVYQIDRAPADKNDLIIVGVKQKFQKEVYMTLKQNGFQNIMFSVKPAYSEERKERKERSFMVRERFFPIHHIAKDSNVILYGAGKIGRKFWNRNNMIKWCNIFMVVDTHHDAIHDFPTEVLAPESIMTESDYDHVLISVINEQLKKEIIDNLIQIGVPEEKIVDDTDCFLEYEANVFKVKHTTSNTDDTALKVGFHPGGVMGDNIISLKLYQEIVKTAPNSKIDIFTTFSVFPEIVFYGQKNLNMFIRHAPEQEDFCNYDLIIQSHFEPSIVYYDRNRVVSLCPKLAQKIDILEQYQKDRLVSCSVAQYMNRIQWDRAKFKGWNCYTILGSNGAFEIHDANVDLKINAAFEKRFRELRLDKPYITFNYGASDPLKDGKRQTKMWPYEYHVKLNALVKRRFPQIELIQIGAADVSCVSGADRYILGENLEVTKYILKNALCHFDCEGGLVHMATQLGTKCFVVYGPTPVSFFGYETNTNFASKVCGECCGMIKDWYTRCYRYDRPECMYSILPESVFVSMEEFIREKNGSENFLGGAPLGEREADIRVCIELTGGLGDYIIAKKLIYAILNLEPHLTITLMGRICYLKPVFSDMPQCEKFEEGELWEIDSENFDVTIRVTHVVEIKHFNEESVKIKSKSLYGLIRKLIDTKESYFLYNNDQSYIDAINLKRAKYKGLNRYTMFRHNNLLEIDDSNVPLPLDKDFAKEYESLNLEKFITVNRGADTRSSLRNQTKIWPAKHYNELIALLKKNYPQYEIVQLGITEDEKLEHVDRYILGRDLEVVKYILTNAVIHIDSEGGLVHMATQLGTKCAVVFGPTPVHYYGYRQNINIVGHDCSECMGVSTDWFLHCYRGDEKPRCMESISGAEVFQKMKGFLDGLECGEHD